MRLPKRVLINDRRLELNGRGNAEVFLWGDVHYGSPQCDWEKALGYLRYALKNRIYVIGMGDHIECATRDSVGAGVYEQELNPQEQVDVVQDALEPLAKAGLLLGLHDGNHEERVYKQSGFDVTRMLAASLGVPYLGSAVTNVLRVGRETYVLYSAHGRSTATSAQGKFTASLKLSRVMDADIYAMGHVHQLSEMATTHYRYSTRTRSIEERRQSFVVTGHYLRFHGGYGETLGLAPSATGSPRIVLSSREHRFHVNTTPELD